MGAYPKSKLRDCLVMARESEFNIWISYDKLVVVSPTNGGKRNVYMYNTDNNRVERLQRFQR